MPLRNNFQIVIWSLQLFAAGAVLRNDINMDCQIRSLQPNLLCKSFPGGEYP